MKQMTAKQLVMAASLMALAIILYLIDKQLTVPLNALWATGGATTLAYFLPVMLLAVFFDQRVFFIGITALVFAMFIIGTSAASLVDYGLEYVIPLLSISVFLLAKPYTEGKRLRLFLCLGITLIITFLMYTLAGVWIYGVNITGSALYNGTLMIFPIGVLGILILPIFELYSKLMNRRK